MRKRQPVPVTERPALIPPEGLDPEREALVSSLQRSILENPDFLLTALNVYGQDPPTVDRVMDFAHAHPEGWMPSLQKWREVLTITGVDKSFEFDNDTERAIKKDELLEKMTAAFEKTGGTDETQAARIRRRRLAIYLERMAKYRRQNSTAA